jgi:4-aminobutyrate aminotransferase-like enzyme
MLPEILTEIPGPRSLSLARRLAQTECRNTTFLANDWPVFWERSQGANVWDADGNRFLDMTSGFGVAGIGYGFNGDALRKQSELLMHAMGDVHPARVKVELCEVLSSLTFEKWCGQKGKCLFGSSGFEAIEAALKTAVLASGRSGILSFDGGYHGLGYGALLGQGIGWFREPFTGQLARVTQRLSFPSSDEELEIFRKNLWELDGQEIGAVLVEPIQGRGGIVVPPYGFLQELRNWCDHCGAILIFDEIYTGFLRSGKMFACAWEEVVPDLICLGKALAGGFPISVCVGKADVMDAWPETHGEALHTSTFLGNPMGCAMALEAIRQYRKPETILILEQASNLLSEALHSLSDLSCIKEIRGRGLMMGIEINSSDLALDAVKGLLQDGIFALPDGPHGDVIAFTPPFCITREEIFFAIEKLRDRLQSNQISTN